MHLKPLPKPDPMPKLAPKPAPATATAMPMLPDPVHIQARLRDGTEVLLQPLRPEDREALLDAFEHLSPRSRQMRFLHPLGRMPPALLDRLMAVDAEDHIAWTARQAADGKGMGVARYIRPAHDATEAEMAVTILDDAQGHGLGSLLLGIIMRSAAAHGIDTFTGMVLCENVKMRHLIADLGGSFEFAGGDALSFRMPVPAQADGLPDTPTGRVIAALYHALPDWLPADYTRIEVPEV